MDRQGRPHARESGATTRKTITSNLTREHWRVKETIPAQHALVPPAGQRDDRQEARNSHGTAADDVGLRRSKQLRGPDLTSGRGVAFLPGRDRIDRGALARRFTMMLALPSLNVDRTFR
ncbi:protein of unknown function [Streptomyces murinus]